MESPDRHSSPIELEERQLRSHKKGIEFSSQKSADANDRQTKSLIVTKIQHRFSETSGRPARANGHERQRCIGASAEGDESSLDSYGVDDGGLTKDPFSPECKIPLPVTFAPFDYGWVEPSFIRKRNERERQRVRNVNDGFERLRSHLPLLNRTKDRRLSKVETLRYAISYIRHLQAMLKD